MGLTMTIAPHVTVEPISLTAQDVSLRVLSSCSYRKITNAYSSALLNDMQMPIGDASSAMLTVRLALVQGSSSASNVLILIRCY